MDRCRTWLQSSLSVAGGGSSWLGTMTGWSCFSGISRTDVEEDAEPLSRREDAQSSGLRIGLTPSNWSSTQRLGGLASTCTLAALASRTRSITIAIGPTIASARIGGAG